MIKSKLILCLSVFYTLMFTSCGSDDNSDDTNQGGTDDDCGIEVISVTEITDGAELGNFIVRVKNEGPTRTGITADIKYFKDNVLIGSGVGSSGTSVDENETVEFTTITADITSTDDYDCTEYIIKVFNQTSICEVKGPECN